MAPGTEVSPLIIPLENGHMKESVPAIEADVDSAENTDNLSQLHAGKPPRTTAGMRHCLSATRLANLAELVDAGVVPHLVLPAGGCGGRGKAACDGSKASHEIGVAGGGLWLHGWLKIKLQRGEWLGGSYSDQGPKSFMEDEYVCCDNLWQHIGPAGSLPLPGAFYGVFDGHNGKDAAIFTRKNLLKFITEDANFPSGIKKAVRNSYFKVDHSFADAASLDKSSGTTALIALIIGRNMLIANAGDSRAVLGKRGRAVELSKDHKPNCTSERTRIEKMGGVVYDGYLNGQLSVARALGDWHLKGPKGSSYPLSCEPELHEIVLTDEDEFLIIGCDGLWDVMSSQCAVTMVRKELTQHNDPERCSKELVKEALSRNSSDNLTVVVICFSSDPPSRIEIPRSQKRRSISAEGLDLLKGVLNGV